MAETLVEGACIRYDDAGRGEPALLFIPGWCTTRKVFRKLAPWCATLHRTLVVDLPGHGESDLPGPGFDDATVVRALRAVIDASGARQVVPVALSHGDWWALELRRQLGARVPALVLLDWHQEGDPLRALATLSPPVPILHLHAEPGAGAWLEAQRSFASSHPWFQVQTLPARSHSPLLEFPEEMAVRIGRFLDFAPGTHPARLDSPPLDSQPLGGLVSYH